MATGQTTSTKATILRVGAEIVHNQGFNNTGIQEILRAAGVPKGSFYFYFQSKNDFGLQLIDFYALILNARLDEAAARSDLSPLNRLRTFFAGFTALFAENKCRGGCPIGNMAQEMGDLNQDFRERLQSVYADLQSRMARLLEQAQKERELDPGLQVRELAGFLLNAWQGAMVQMKVDKSTAPLQTFERMIFDCFLALDSKRTEDVSQL
jgi:TetR/AcrR family transcriptional repressor of nem operon